MLENMDFIGIDAESGGGSCPGVYRSSRGGRPGFVFQGAQLDAEWDGKLQQRSPDERGIWVPDNVVAQAAELL
jgi:hypothetical protein